MPIVGIDPIMITIGVVCAVYSSLDTLGVVVVVLALLPLCDSNEDCSYNDRYPSIEILDTNIVVPIVPVTIAV